MDPMVLVAAGVALVIGFALAFFMQNSKMTAKVAEIQKEFDADVNGKANAILDKAKKKADDMRHKARIEIKDMTREEKKNLEDEMRTAKKEITAMEKEITKKEVELENQAKQIEQKQENIKAREFEVEESKKKLEDLKAKYEERRQKIVSELERVASMTRDEAKNILLDQMLEEAKVDAAKQIVRVEEEMKEEAEKKAKRIIGISIQRFAGEYVAERTITSVELPSDDLKGRLIGREGRNIRAFEQICGVDLIIDDTPGTVVISSFNVVRREIARVTLERLIADGRIHPAKIEEFYEKSKNEFEGRLRELGEKAQMEIGVHGIHPEILKLIGALNYRTSYTQNQYQHALEAAFLCGAMASELGINVKQARRAGLLHDIGKVLDAAAEGSHAVVGADFARKYGEHPDIVHAIRAHHDDEKPESVLAHIVAASDALSGARPGARKAMQESYISRLTDIETIVNSFEGVSRSYAISAGREVRVLVENAQIDDENTVMLSRDIAKKIEEEMSYPGTIKITVLRETKAVGIAK